MSANSTCTGRSVAFRCLKYAATRGYTVIHLPPHLLHDLGAKVVETLWLRCRTDALCIPACCVCRFALPLVLQSYNHSPFVIMHPFGHSRMKAVLEMGCPYTVIPLKFVIIFNQGFNCINRVLLEVYVFEMCPLHISNPVQFETFFYD